MYRPNCNNFVRTCFSYNSRVSNVVMVYWVAREKSWRQKMGMIGRKVQGMPCVLCSPIHEVILRWGLTRPKPWGYSSCARTPPRHQGEESGVDWKASVGVWEGRYCRFSFRVQGRMICSVGAAFHLQGSHAAHCDCYSRLLRNAIFHDCN